MAFKEKLQQFKDQLGALKQQGFFPKHMGRLDKLLVGAVLTMIFAGTTILGSATYFVVSNSRKAHSEHSSEGRHIASESNIPHQDEHADTEAHPGPVIGADSIPKSIRERQDGERDSDYDLADPEITQEKGLAGLLENDLEVSVGFRTVDVQEIVSGSRMGNVVDAMVYLDVVFEVETHKAQKEIEARRTEIKALVSGLVGSFSAEYLRSVEGKEALKLEIFNEMNRILHDGRVTDVLLANFMIR
jgi:flagellar basal body-associated protein FliL